ncbi:MAG: hypothetical protein E6J34_00115 [Chloroflexi bacterium]|nr:MAG: hypothetical protein E6J34_00115 [Chloroflexota bacterium]
MNESHDTTLTSQVSARSTRSTRFTGAYSNTTQLDDIIDHTCSIELSELVHEKARNVSQYLQTLGITIVDVLRHDLYHETTERVRRKNRQWFTQQGAVELLDICGNSCPSFAFREAICQLATKFLTQELDKFIFIGELIQPSTTITPETLTKFSIHTLSETMMKGAPLLSRLFQALVSDDKVNTAEKSMFDEEKEGFAEKCLSKTAQREWRERQRTNRWIMSLSIICYAKIQKVNLQQQVMGYYLMSGNTPKRVFEVLHQLGMSVSYSSVVRTMKTIAKAAMEVLQRIPTEYPQFWTSKDNMDFMARVRDQRLDHQGALLHYSAGYVAINRFERINGDFEVEVEMLEVDDIIEMEDIDDFVEQLEDVW